jgi:hypothetical protein
VLTTDFKVQIGTPIAADSMWTCTLHLLISHLFNMYKWDKFFTMHKCVFIIELINLIIEVNEIWNINPMVRFIDLMLKISLCMVKDLFPSYTTYLAISIDKTIIFRHVVNELNMSILYVDFPTTLVFTFNLFYSKINL